MLDSFSLALLNVICVNSNAFKYKVFSTQFLLEEMPKGLASSESAISEGLNFLSEREYISLKYQDEKEACIAPTQKGRLVFENRIDQEIEKGETNRKYFLFAFLGSFSGVIFCAIITLIIWLVRS